MLKDLGASLIAWKVHPTFVVVVVVAAGTAEHLPQSWEFSGSFDSA